MDNKFNKKLSQALSDENKAYKFYWQLIKMTSNEKIKAKLTEIANEEKTHHQELEQIKDMLR